MSNARIELLLLSGRVLLGLIFVMSGVRKLMGLDAFAASLADRGVPISGFMSILGAVVETVGGAAVVIGLQTRWAAALIILFIIVATAISHRFWEFSGAARQMQQTQFMKNVSMLGGFLLLIACGGGRFSLDGLYGKK